MGLPNLSRFSLCAFAGLAALYQVPAVVRACF
jgi:hypothetical protein